MANSPSSNGSDSDSRYHSLLLPRLRALLRYSESVVELRYGQHQCFVNKADLMQIFKREWSQFINSPDVLHPHGDSIIANLKNKVDTHSDPDQIDTLLLTSLYMYLVDGKKHRRYTKGGEYYVDTSQCGHTECRIVTVKNINFMHEGRAYKVQTPPIYKYCCTEVCIESQPDEERLEYNRSFLAKHPESELTIEELNEWRGSYCMWPDGDASEEDRTFCIDGFAEQQRRIFKFVMPPRGHEYRVLAVYTMAEYLELI